MNLDAPDTMIGLAAFIAVQLLVTAGSFGHTWLSNRRHQSMRSDVRDVKDNVVNGHGNLRVDIDRLIELGEENQRLGEANQTGLAELRGEVNGLTHRVDQITRPSIVRPAPRTGW